MDFNQIEKDFIEFISIKYSRPYKEAENIFRETKNKFKFTSLAYKELTLDMYDLFKILYDDSDEKRAVDAYKFFDLIHLFRFISYSYPRPYHGFGDNLISFFKILRKKEFRRLYEIMKARIFNGRNRGPSRNYAALAKFLLNKIGGYPVIVDYGCGLGYVSFEIGLLNKNSKIYLVDIDSLVLEFAKFRFNKYGINVETIIVSKDDLYPNLPKHNLCIATDVMEHIAHPLNAYNNIYESLEKGGILYGDFDNREVMSFHISPDLGKLREKISNDFEEVDAICYRKK